MNQKQKRWPGFWVQSPTCCESGVRNGMTREQAASRPGPQGHPPTAVNLVTQDLSGACPAHIRNLSGDMHSGGPSKPNQGLHGALTSL